MKTIIVGCGRMGSELAKNLVAEKHEIVVIDELAEKFLLLGSDFPGKVVTGLGFDKEVLEEAGIGRVDAVVVCTNSDEANALIARIARKIYQVPRVIARLFDPRKAEIYNMLGIQIISTTDWGIKRATELLSFNQLDSVMSLGNGEVEIVKIDVPELLIGRSIKEFTNNFLEIRVICINRDNRTFFPTKGTLLKKGDVIFVAVVGTAVKTLKSQLGL